MGAVSEKHKFDDIEVQKVGYWHNCGGGYFEAMEENDEAPDADFVCWTVYGHHGPGSCQEGGVVALVDCPTRDVAEILRDVLLGDIEVAECMADCQFEWTRKYQPRRRSVDIERRLKP